MTFIISQFEQCTSIRKQLNQALKKFLLKVYIQYALLKIKFILNFNSFYNNLGMQLIMKLKNNG